MANRANRTQAKAPVSGQASHRKKLIVNIAIIAVSVLFLLIGSGCIYVDHMLGRINIQTEPAAEASSSLEGSAAASEQNQTFSQQSGDTMASAPTMLNGLYHDDAIMNILVVGVDDYQPNDVGRTDSMILVSLDTRHEKLKMTSLMRDMYVQIPNHGSNRINTAYSMGGPALTVQTIESNFGVDIDRWVVVDFDAFDHIMDRLGGVSLEITQGEADLINQYSGEDWSKRLSAGMVNMTGKQARYYSRIRKIGTDFARTERQRKVMTSLVEKFKGSNLMTINNILYDTLPEITTNIGKEEIIRLAANSLTYLNYPVKQNRLPTDKGYTEAKATIGGIPGNDVLIPDLPLNAKELAEFIYESDLPNSIN